MTDHKVLVCGGRDYNNTAKIIEVLNKYKKEVANIKCIIEGGAKGADSGAALYAIGYNIPSVRHPADWELHGKQAGILRNIEMLNMWEPDVVIAFPGGKGTAHMIKVAKDANVTVVEVEDDQEENPQEGQISPAEAGPPGSQ